ncbi:Schwann cell myelin protein isoform X1 [Triplophysa rosa]|uniref:Schwann cell myelin protein n=1 Tax=Triplophysa rosa TaxID=992332 RepID=A0A9W7WGP9_TRIRA|nr:Schwann cell myelin protein isoform X1 [Triplophysa rosa]KAI7799006.1 putative Schwann cell myelin protein [Triplophysa rosa]
MTGPKVFIVIVWILKGAVSNQWEIKMPQEIDVISGFCVQIPCTFEIPDSFTKYLNKSVEAVWKKTDASLGSTVFSSKSVASVLKGSVTGNLLSKNCTTVFQNFPAGSNDTYFFRLQGPEPLIYTFLQGVNINVHADLLAPMLSPHIDVLEVSEGKNVTLTCSTVLSCPSRQPVMHWSVTLGGKIDPTIQVDEFGQTLLVSSQMFNASPLNDGLKVSCFLVYSQDIRRPIETSITLRVLYTPQNTIALANPSGPLYEGNVVTLSCQSDANPAVKRYEWFKETGNGELVLKAQKQTLTMTVSSNVLGLYVCKANNIHGDDQSTAVTVELKGCQCTIAPYIMCGVLTGFLILITVVDLVKYKSLLKRLKWVEDLRGPMAYATLNRTNDSSVYNEIQITANRTEEDYVNKN